MLTSASYSRPTSSLNVSPFIRAQLTAAGFRTLADLSDIAPVELSKEARISHEDALAVLLLLRKAPPTSITVTEALARDIGRTPITTSCKEIDDMLGGRGILLGKITEICGAPGIGKTQFGMQLAVNVQIPSILGGCGGDALYIDTEGSFIPRRVEEIACVSAQDINNQLLALPPSIPQSDHPLVSQADVLDHIHYYRVHNHIELVAIVNILDEILDANPTIRLVVIDSIAFHFRLNFTDMALRTRLLNRIALGLARVAEEKSIAVVMTNQMTTKFDKTGGGSGGIGRTGTGKLVPALGESWGHASTVRIQLFWHRNIRRAMLVKSPMNQERVVEYTITPEGIRSYKREQEQCEGQNEDG